MRAVHSGLCLCLLVPAFLHAAEPDRRLDGFLREGRLQEGKAAFARPANDAERFSLAVVTALDGLRTFSAGLSRIGVGQSSLRQVLPFLRVAPRADANTARPAERATPEGVAALFRGLHESLRSAQDALANLTGEDFQVEVNLDRVRLDLDGDGVAGPDENPLARLRPPGPGNDPDEEGFRVRFDASDAIWLRGYTYALGGTLDLLRAYDWRPVWNQCAHQLFPKADPKPPLAAYTTSAEIAGWADLIAGVHDMRLPLVDPDGPRRAVQAWRRMAAESRLCWKRVLAETDDDHEWLPSPAQHGPFGAVITEDQVRGWHAVLDELDAIAAGKRLLPHWRVRDGVGINLDRFAAHPPPLDLVLMIQGSAFLPYLEEGVVSDRRRWNELTQAYRGAFFRFALWSN